MIFRKKKEEPFIRIPDQDLRAHLERAKRDLERARQALQKIGFAERRPLASLYISQVEKRLHNVEQSLKN